MNRASFDGKMCERIVDREGDEQGGKAKNDGGEDEVEEGWNRVLFWDLYGGRTGDGGPNGARPHRTGLAGMGRDTGVGRLR